jgi:Zn-dependent protease with chaperone function
METSPTAAATTGGTQERASPVPSPIKEKWQGAVTQGSGFVAIPLALLRMQTKYGLSQTEMMVLINLLAHWWEPSRGVYPRSSIIAARLGVAKRTVQRATERMERMGLIERHIDGDGRRVFAFDGLVARLSRDASAAFIQDAAT